MIYDATGSTDLELWKTVLGSVPEGATRLLASRGELQKSGGAELRSILGRVKSERVLAVLELGVRLATTPLARGQRISASRDVVAAYQARLGRLDHEEFHVIALDAKNRPIGDACMGRGGMPLCPVAPSDVFRMLVREGAVGALFVHNHPSGEPTPSSDDVALTDRLRRAGEVLGVRVLDHIIVAADGHFSFLDAGLLGSLEPMLR